MYDNGWSLIPGAWKETLLTGLCMVYWTVWPLQEYKLWHVYVCCLSILVAYCNGTHVAMQISVRLFAGEARLEDAVSAPQEDRDEQEFPDHRSLLCRMVDVVPGPLIWCGMSFYMNENA